MTRLAECLRRCAARMAWLCLLLACGCRPAAPPPPETAARAADDRPYLVLVSFDGFRADYVDRFDLPHLRRVIQRGARAAGMTPVFPSLTFPNHYSLATGLYPEHHGIIENTFYDPGRNQTYSMREQQSVGDGTWYGGEPIWVTAETQETRAACFFWPGSEAPIKGVRPTYWTRYDGAIPNDARVSAVLDWLRLPEERRPHVVTLYFSELDSASHRNPLDSPAIERAARSLDRSLGRLVDGIDRLPISNRVYLLLTSDHGMVDTSAAQAVALRSIVDPAEVKVGYEGPVTGLHVPGGSGRARRIADRINARLRHGRAYVRQEVPERHHYRANPRIGDVVIIMDEPWTIAARTPLISLIRDRWGHHGWDAALPSMRALFVLAGPGIAPATTIPEVENVDVYPLMTELLGLRAADGIDGRPGRIRDLLSASVPDR